MKSIDYREVFITGLPFTHCNRYLTTRNGSLHNFGLSHLILRTVVIVATVITLLFFRLWILNADLPIFPVNANPASFAEELQTRILTYSYLFFFNAQLLLAPITLCYDWQWNSIPLLDSILDPRNLGTLLFFGYMISLSLTSLVGKTTVSLQTLARTREIIHV